jgi:heme/copper-type cytochrome/quinol oxidase subunit 2
MQMKITVVEEAAFKTWLKDKATFAEVMKPKEELKETVEGEDSQKTASNDTLTIAQIKK